MCKITKNEAFLENIVSFSCIKLQEVFTMINKIKYEISRINIVCGDKSAKAGILEKKGTIDVIKS